MPSLTIELKLRSSSTKELTFEEVDGNFVNLKNAIISVNDTLNDQDTKFSGISHDHGMSGMVAHFARKTAPIGWLVCDGAAVSRTTYANLFAAIGVEFGVGDGVNTFNLPDLRGEFIRGWDKGRGVDAGRTFGSWQKSSVDGYDPSAQHPGVGGLCEAEANDLDPDASLRKNGFDVVDVNLYQGLYVTGVSAGSAAKPGTLNGKLNTGGWALGGSKPRNVALLPCIKF